MQRSYPSPPEVIDRVSPRQVTVQTTVGERVVIAVPNPLKTMRWLVSEVKAKCRKEQGLVGLRTRDEGEALDVVLMLMGRPVYFLRNGEELCTVVSGAL